MSGDKVTAKQILPGDTEAPGKRRNRTRAFLAAFRETASVTAAAKAAGIGRDHHYRRLRKDPLYRAAFEEAEVVAAQTLEDEAVRRAMEGHDEPVFYQGKPTGYTVRRYSEGLLMMLLKGRRPERYRDKTITHQGKVTLSHQARMLKEAFTLEELQEMQKRMDAIDKKETVQ